MLLSISKNWASLSWLVLAVYRNAHIVSIKGTTWYQWPHVCSKVIWWYPNLWDDGVRCKNNSTQKGIRDIADIKKEIRDVMKKWLKKDQKHQKACPVSSLTPSRKHKNPSPAFSAGHYGMLLLRMSPVCVVFWAYAVMCMCAQKRWGRILISSQPHDSLPPRKETPERWSETWSRCGQWDITHHDISMGNEIKSLLPNDDAKETD